MAQRKIAKEQATPSVIASNDGGIIDLRSDVVTPPTEEMWTAMRQAKLGMASFGDDATVHDLVQLGATMLGKEAALYVPTCTMANLLALMVLGRAGAQVVLESSMHIVWSEGWGLAHPGGLFPRLLEGIRGAPDPSAIEDAVAKPRFGRLPRTSLICLENSHNNAGGTILTVEQTAAIAAAGHRHGIPVHLDGARLFNAAAALGISASRLAEPAETVAISLNKGLSAPEGALLCGPRSVVEEARAAAHRVGGASVHKAGIAAAAGIVALTTMVDRLADDNRRAGVLGKRLSRLDGLGVDLTTVQTNIVNVELRPDLPAKEFVARLASRGVLAWVRSTHQVRFVTHRLIGDSEIERAARATAAVLQSVEEDRR